MIQPAFGAPLMASVGSPMLLATGLTPALRAAVALAAITARANPEKRSHMNCGKTSAGELLPHEPPSACVDDLTTAAVHAKVKPTPSGLRFA